MKVTAQFQVNARSADGHRHTLFVSVFDNDVATALNEVSHLAQIAQKAGSRVTFVELLTQPEV